MTEILSTTYNQKAESTSLKHLLYRCISAALLPIQRSTCLRNFSYKTPSHSLNLQHQQTRYVPLPIINTLILFHYRLGSQRIKYTTAKIQCAVNVGTIVFVFLNYTVLID